jgi:Zn-dependent M32 family carboxypeptidase
MEASQLNHKLIADCDGLVDTSTAGEWLIKQMFRRGSETDWNESLLRATGERLEARYFVDEFISSPN